MSSKQKAGKAGFFTRTKTFLRSSWLELKKVHWPNKKELWTYTGVVIVTVVIVAAIILAFDSALSFVFGLFL